MDPFGFVACTLTVPELDASNEDLPPGTWQSSKLASAMAGLYLAQATGTGQDSDAQDRVKKTPELDTSPQQRKPDENVSKGNGTSDDVSREPFSSRMNYHRFGGLVAVTFDPAEERVSGNDSEHGSTRQGDDRGGQGTESVVVNSVQEAMASLQQNVAMAGIPAPALSEELRERFEVYKKDVFAKYAQSGLAPAADDWNRVYLTSPTWGSRGPAILPEMVGRQEQEPQPKTDATPGPYQSPPGFSYSPLPADSIRLVTLLPSSDRASGIQCHLRHYSLDRAPPYEALSYTWGSKSFPLHMRLNNGVLEITRNLGEALRHLRSPTKSRILWIDAVCINQNDLAERNAQVRRMCDIYRKATEVVVWLGVETKTSPAAFSFLYHLQSRCRRLTGPAPGPPAWIIQINKHHVKELVTDSAHLAGWEALADLMDRPWWSRAWVLQEVVVGSRVKMQCGIRSFPWELFAMAGTVIFRYRSLFMLVAAQQPGAQNRAGRLKEIMEKCEPYLNAHIIRSRFHSRDGEDSMKPSLTNLLSWTRRLEATNPRDNVYAILNLLPAFGMDNPIFDVDYSLSVAEVYTRFAVQILLQQRSLGLLSLVFRRPESPPGMRENQNPATNTGAAPCSTRAGASLPSWVPDLDIAATAYPLERHHFDPYSRTLLYRASHSKADLPFTFSADLRTLSVYGLHMCTIQHLGESCRPQNVSLEIEFWKSYVQRLADLNENEGSFSQGHFITTFWRTLLADQIQLGEMVSHRLGPEIAGIAHIPPKDETEEEKLRSFLTGEAPQPWYDRRFFIADNGMMGLAPRQARKGDLVVVLMGGAIPLILRQDGVGGSGGDNGDDADGRQVYCTFVGER
ncbi:Heterokaryon incompatibility protein 6, OR allele [Madurella mycetomatis]|uniref:Heterokaryon incompatibility protein 6, OR allele n=1 Tax=Madurella mycetomatis TaxID=100816 RepID=A0A175VW61_9PEZI|nr:Heterokaryon incompatibility protein 6, OR allele [Madurella mycetomatis]